MKKNPKINIYLVCAILILASVGLGYVLVSSHRAHSANDYGYPTVSVLPNGQALYQQAVDMSEYSALTISTITKTRIDNQTFTDEKLQNLIRNDAIYRTSEIETMGDFRIETTLTYSDGIAYLALGNSRFCSQMSESEYLSRYAPLAMFDPSIYQNCQAVYNGTVTTVYFSRATDAEEWIAPNYDTFREASGHAVLDGDNRLIRSSYTIQYRLGNALIEKTIEVSATQPESVIEEPNSNDYLPLADLDAPVALEQACGFILQAESISSQISDTIVCEAFGDHRTQNTALKMDGVVDSFTTEINISATSVNSSRGGETTYKEQVITYEDKVYTVIENNGNPVIKTDTAPETMRLYCQNNLVGTILLPEYITSVEVTEENNVRLYSFTANEALSQLMSQSVCQILYQSPDLLNGLASSHTTNIMEGYLAIDVSTGLPVSSGIHYDSVYTVDGFSYPLQYISEQTYIIP